MGILWYFCETSMILLVNLSEKSHFFYITIYQVNTTLFSLKMRLWDFFHKKNTHENGITVVLAIVLEWNTNKEDGDCKSPGGKWSNIFWQRIANPLERLTEDFLIENQPERLAEDFLIENQPERLAEDFLIVHWTNNATPKRAVFWFKSTITTI